MTRALVVLAAVLASGCGSRCKDVAAARTALTSRVGVSNRGADVRVSIPMARANTAIAELLQQKALTVPLDPPDLAPIQVATTLTATVKQLMIVPGSRGHVRFAVVVEIDDPTGNVTAIDAIAEIEPELTRANGASVLAIGIGPQNVLKLKPTLTPAAKAKLGGAAMRWIPANVKAKLPPALVDVAAGKLGEHLTGAAWTALQKTLFLKLGELTAMKLRLPDVPVASVGIQSLTAPDTLVIEIGTDLPVRAGLGPAASVPTEMTVQIAGSVAAELANWAIDKGHAPQWYTRSLAPASKGDFRPRFDYAPGTSHALKVYAFQERGGCSYFKVGVAAKIGMSGDKLLATATDREIEAMNANVAIEAAAWVKYFLVGWVNKSKKVAAHTQLTIGGRALLTEVVSARLANDELAFGLALSGDPSSAAVSSR
ncbi:MAG: hypothetical protein H0T46_24555 [Deltaproteobacteria bacterium]|nr:hypothetical protein [Deltaproteobacteria bacterium]